MALAAGSGFGQMPAINSSSVMVSGSSLSWVLGIKYSRPGRTSRTELILEETCLMLSRIIPLSSQKIRLLCLPISSMISILWHTSPNSFKCSRWNCTTRSMPGCVISVIRALPICFRKSMQKLGAVRGLIRFLDVK